MATNPLRHIPSVNELLESPPIKRLVDRVNRHLLLARVRGALDELRGELQSAAAEVKLPNVAELAERIASRILASGEPVWQPVVNATGVLLRFGVGSAPLADEAVAEMSAVAHDYLGGRGDLDFRSPQRCDEVIEPLAAAIVGSETALAINSPAAAMTLALTALGGGREVIVARAEVTGFESGATLAGLAAAAGATLREVGSVDRAERDDYAHALGDRTGAILKVHSSSFAVAGAVWSVPLAELVELGRSRDVPVVHDLGLGGLVDCGPYGLPGEPTAADSVRQGADVVLLRGAGLLGGPHCGLLLGRRRRLGQIAAHPLAAGLQAEPLTLAALAATLRLYQDPSHARRAVPVLGLLATPMENLKLRAEHLAPQLAACSIVKSAAPIAHGASLAGAAVPGQEIASWAVAVEPAGLTATQLARRLREARPGVVGTVENERVVLNLRTVFPRQDQDLVTALASLS